MFWNATPTTLGGGRGCCGAVAGGAGASAAPIAPPLPAAAAAAPSTAPRPSGSSSSSSSAPAVPSSKQGPPDAPPLIGLSTWMAMKLLALWTYCVTSTRLMTPEVTHALSPPAG